MRFYKIIFALLLLLPMLGAQPASAAGQCYCYTEFGQAPLADAICSSEPLIGCNKEKVGAKFKDCTWEENAGACDAKVVQWKKDNDSFLGGQAAEAQQQTKTETSKGLIRSAIPDCVFADKWDPNGPCADVSVFVLTLIGFGRSLFTVIGALALVMFIYGGFMLILSQGNPEKVKKGTDAMMAAVIGLVIAFGGYALIIFLGKAVGLKSGFGL